MNETTNTKIKFYCIACILLFSVAVFGQSSTAYTQTDSVELLQIYLEKIQTKTRLEVEQDSIYYYLLKGEQLAEELEQDSILYEIRTEFSYQDIEQLKYETALKRLHQNEQYAINIKDYFLEMRVYLSYGHLYSERRKNDPDSLIYYTSKGLEIAKKRKDKLHTLIAETNLAKAYLKREHSRGKALPLLLHALILTEQEELGHFQRSPCLLHLGEYYYYIGDYETCEKYLKESVLNSEKNKSYGWLVMAYERLYQTYEKTENYSDALKAYKKFQSYTDTINNQKTQEKVKQIEAELDLERKQQKIKNLAQLNQQQQEQVKRQKQFLFLSIGAIILIIALAFLAFLNYKKRLASNRALIQAQQEINKTQNRFFTNISHEFRTPLTVISGTAAQLEQEEQKNIIQRNSENLLQLVNQVLDLSKLEAGALQLELVQDNIIVYLKYLTESFHSLAQKKNIELHFHSEISSLFMDYDREKIKYIVHNLIGNAIKFTPEDGKIEIAIKQEVKQLILKIADTGIGIPSTELGRIFERFYQGENHKNIGGTGIGLSLVKDLVDLMEGDVQVNSELDQQTTFTITLPIHQNANLAKHPIPEIQANNKPKNILIPSWMQNEQSTKILIIEDHPDVSQYIEQCLPNHLQILRAFDGELGIQKAIAEVPDLIISDVMMPKKDGYEVCKCLKKNKITSHIPIILLTAKASDEEKLEGLEQGADAYLIKPFNEKELNLRVHNLLENLKKWQEKFAAGFDFRKVSQNPEEQFLQQAHQLILKNLDNTDYTVEQFCKNLAVSRTQLHRKLKALTNFSATQFINDIRLTQAHQLLQQGKMSVSEVAYATGFQYPNYFAKVYRRKFGISPSEVS